MVAHTDTIPGAFAADVIKYVPNASWGAVIHTKKPVTILFFIVMAYIL